MKHLATVVTREPQAAGSVAAGSAPAGSVPDGTVPGGSAAETIEVVANPRHLARYARVLARQARTVSRRQRWSRHHRQAQLRLTRTHAAVTRSRRDGLHKLTTRLAATCGTVVIEDLHVAGRVRPVTAPIGRR